MEDSKKAEDQEAGTVLSVTNVKVCRKRMPAPASDSPGW